MAKVKPEHNDLIGRPIIEGCKVVVAKGNVMRVCTAEKLTKRMVHVVPVNDGYPKIGFYVRGERIVVIDNEDMLSFILKGHIG